MSSDPVPLYDEPFPNCRFNPKPLDDERIAELMRAPWDEECLPARLLATVEHFKKQVEGLAAHIKGAWCEETATGFRCLYCDAPVVRSPNTKIEHSGTCPTQLFKEST